MSSLKIKYGEGYGYDGRLNDIRKKEYGFVGDEVYLDHAGTALYAKSLIERHGKELTTSLFGNPHSRSASSERSTEMVERARLAVLRMFRASSAVYTVVFTANASAAAKLVGEGMSTIDEETHYAYLEDSHTSLVGLRNMAHSYTPVGFCQMESMLDELGSGLHYNGKSTHVISWPAQSNFSGQRYPTRQWLSTLSQIQSGTKQIYTVLDAAAISSTLPPDLSGSLVPDFVLISFYKIFGYPDLGALIVRKEAGEEFFKNRRYFGGGTVEGLTARNSFNPRHSELSAQLEDGTLPFHSILALSIALQVHQLLYISFGHISKHTSVLAQYLYDGLTNLKHQNGQPLCEIYCLEKTSSMPYLDPTSQGPILTFNLKDEDGSWIGYSDFDRIANSCNIHIRTGTLCNSGSTAHFVGISENEIMDNHAKGHVCGDDRDVINDKPTGAIRVSLGACSDVNDVMKLVECLRDYYIKEASLSDVEMSTGPTTHLGNEVGYVSDITLFPIKSCGGFHVPRHQRWQVNQEGLKWDREFCLVNRINMTILTLKKHPKMALIKPIIDEESQAMVVKDKCNSESLYISLKSKSSVDEKQNLISARICGDDISVIVYNSKEVVEFFTEILGIDCTIARFSEVTKDNCLSTRFHKPHLNGPLDYDQEKNTQFSSTPIPIAMTNSSPLLLISNPSVKQLQKDGQIDNVDPRIFRGNIVIDGKNLQGYAEDSWNDIKIGGYKFNVS